MSPGAKVFLTLTGVGVTLGVLAIAASKKASAAPAGGTVVVPPHDDLPPAVTPSEPEGGFDRSGPFAVPGVQDAAEASRNLLSWWSAEGRSLVASDTDPNKPNVPIDFGSQPADLSGAFGARTQAVARAFEHYNGLTPEDGALTNPLLLALRRWADSQALPPQALPPAQSSAPPAPIVLPSAPPVAPPIVPLPPIVPQNPPVVPVPPVLPAPPNVTNQPPQVLPPVVGPVPVPPGPVPLPPVQTVPLPPIVAPAPSQAPPAPPASTPVSADTAAMVDTLLKAEGTAGWNRVEPIVQAWQKPRGLKADGLFGPKTALMVAQEFGTVPIVRVWPAGSTKAKVLQSYRASLQELANGATDQTRAAQLRVSAQREQGQGFGPKRGTAAPLPGSLQVQIAKVA